MQGCKIYFTIGANQEEGVVESIEHREDGTTMATIRYETKKTGETKHFNRNVEKIESAVSMDYCLNPAIE
ncbi:hypothetical protein NDA16_000354 [Ustilago loliicola]|nr:hypothetical protein NDA16_000354 [Ustilago loliicola]